MRPSGAGVWRYSSTLRRVYCAGPIRRRARLRVIFGGHFASGRSLAGCRSHRNRTFGIQQSAGRARSLIMHSSIPTLINRSNPSLRIAGSSDRGAFLTYHPPPPGYSCIYRCKLLKNCCTPTKHERPAFFLLGGPACYIKPVVGILSDACSDLRQPSRSYILIGALAAVAAGFALLVAASKLL